MNRITLKKVILVSTTLLLAASFPFCFSGCRAERYNVDYCGQKACYANAKDSYKAGSKVKLYFHLIATDTDYSFTLDGDPVDWSYDDKKGFVIEFTMPNHDVKLESHSRNSMLPDYSE